MAYAISEEDAASAPKPLEGEDAYVREMYLKGRKYFLYVHRFVSCYGFFYLMFLQFFFLPFMPNTQLVIFKNVHCEMLFSSSCL